MPKDAHALASDAKWERVENEYDALMLGTVIRAIKAQRRSICNRWEMLLCARPHRSPLANPEILSYKIPETCDEVLERLGFYQSVENVEIKEPICPCGLNPMMDFFEMAEIAMTEGMLRALRTVPDLSMTDRSKSLQVLHQVLHHLRTQEIDLLCSVCQLQSARVTDTLCQFEERARSR